MKTTGEQMSSLSEIKATFRSDLEKCVARGERKGLDLPESVLQAWSSTSAPILEAKSAGFQRRSYKERLKAAEGTKPRSPRQV
jgi:hypothetical protein